MPVTENDAVFLSLARLFHGELTKMWIKLTGLDLLACLARRIWSAANKDS